MNNIAQTQRRRLIIIALLAILVVTAVFVVSRVTKKHEAKELPKKTTVKPTSQEQEGSQ